MEVVPNLWTTMQKLALAEIWKKLWFVVLAPFPKPVLVPNVELEYQSLPPWLRKRLGKVNEVIDKFTQGSIRKFIEKNTHGTIQIFYESMTDSMVEISILYEETVTNNDETVATSPDETSTSDVSLDMSTQGSQELADDGASSDSSETAG